MGSNDMVNFVSIIPTLNSNRLVLFVQPNLKVWPTRLYQSIFVALVSIIRDYGTKFKRLISIRY